jgi:hypothetical protein
MTSDFTSLLLQGAGGGISATANTMNGSNIGRYIMISGLALQVLSLAIFMMLWLEFMLRLRKADDNLRDCRFAELWSEKKFKAFNYSKIRSQCARSLS